VNLLIITDGRSKECEERAIKVHKELDELFPNLIAGWIDWAEPDALEVAKENKIKKLPAFVFDETVKDAGCWDEFKKNIRTPPGELALWVLKESYTGAKHNPKKKIPGEICGNGWDDTDDGLEDCDDPQCAQSMACVEGH
jgi:hypothetical protein